VGSDADLVLFDPEITRKVDFKKMATRCDWSPYQGWTLGGFPEFTISRGEVIVKQGKFVGQPGRGRFVKRQF